MSVREQVIRLVSNEGCGVLPAEEIHEQRSLLEIGFDSLRYMELVVLLEETFHITFPDEMLEISAETNVSEIIRAVESAHV
ncbi:acyl carrier protein [Brevibacillus fulvus]|uniref:Acyl carrier protein n=1 Tax=Brevibacillus fulvus TaxID=1125967 RepID=A0A938XXS8_9BACL|nr:acyl carrier protein [Brevibacillus fulvus]MBM7589655.1 acyl carrier protein [Brevibacillus fulvus]